MDITNRLCLGTAQFGLPYGAAAGQVQVSFEAVKAILAYAAKSGIGSLDTAASYGESEAVLGSALPPHSFKIVTKTLPIRKAVLEADDLSKIQSAFDLSLSRLNRKEIDCLLVHDAQDLSAQGGKELWAWMERLKTKGVVSRIGASFYDSDTVFRLSDDFPFDVIQIPFNLFDQRAEKEGLFSFCRERSITTHVRSIYLQGLILADKNFLPSHLVGLKPYLACLHKFSTANKMSIQDLALAYVARIMDIERMVVGVHDLEQITQLISAWSRICDFDVTQIDWQQFACEDPKLIDPRLWAH